MKTLSPFVRRDSTRRIRPQTRGIPLDTAVVDPETRFRVPGGTVGAACSRGLVDPTPRW